MKKIVKLFGLMTIAAALLISCKPSTDNPGSEPETPETVKEVTIWEGSYTLNGNWDGATCLDKEDGTTGPAPTIEASKFADIVAGGTITIYANGTSQLKANTEGWPEFPGLAEFKDPQWGNINISDKLVWVLTSEDAELLKASGLVLFGANITYTKITFTPAE